MEVVTSCSKPRSSGHRPAMGSDAKLPSKASDRRGGLGLSEPGAEDGNPTQVVMRFVS